MPRSRPAAQIFTTWKNAWAFSAPPVDWLQVQIELGRLAPEPVEAALFAQGAVAIEYRDAGNQPILEPAPGATPLWERLWLSALLPADSDEQLLRLAVAAAIAPAALPPMLFARLTDQDWVRRFRASLEPRCFGHGLWILPADAPVPDDARAIVRLEPGLAFGSGDHPTTALCLEWLARLECRGALLDFGCGSGVLTLAAISLGADRAVAVDIDPQAREACADNAQRNGCSDRVTVIDVDELHAGQRFDAVVANILSGPLMELAPELAARLLPGAPIALSGILESQADEVGERYSPWVDFGPPAQRGDWVLLSGLSRGRI